MGAEAQLSELNLVLPPAPQPAGFYKPIVVINQAAYLSGHMPILPDGTMMTGRLGDEVDQQHGYQAARQTGLNMLATLKNRLGSLDRVDRVVKIFGMVFATPDFDQHPAVINGCSELFAQVFGPDRGVGARSAAGTVSLPAKISVEIEAIFEIK